MPLRSVTNINKVEREREKNYEIQSTIKQWLLRIIKVKEEKNKQKNNIKNKNR